MPGERSVIVAQKNAGTSDDVVVFLPPAGSAASPYFSLGACLPHPLAAVHCEMPGRGRLSHRPSPSSVGAAADLWAEELAALLPGRRLHLFGHSLGALFAYEVTCRLEAGGGPRVATLCVSGAREPGSPARALVATAFAALRGRPGEPDGPDDERRAWLTADLAMRQEHRTAGQPVRAALALFCGTSDPFARPAEIQRWRGFSTGPYLGLFVFRGGHDYYLCAPEQIAAAVDGITRRGTHAARGTRPRAAAAPPAPAPCAPVPQAPVPHATRAPHAARNRHEQEWTCPSTTWTCRPRTVRPLRSIS